MTTVTLHGLDVPVTVIDGATPAVVLMPGGAAGCDDYFPDLVEGLAGQMVVQHDRVGTGRAPAPADPPSLRSWSADTVAMLDQLGLDRVVLVGHSLGGALAAQLLMDAPERIAGALLLDPTTVNDPAQCKQIAGSARGIAKAIGLPVVGPALEKLMVRLSKPKGLRPSALRSYDAMLQDGWIDDTARAVTHLVEDAQAFQGRTYTGSAPVVVVTADRKPGHKARRNHERLAELLKGRIEVWPNTGHTVHLQRPDLVVERVKELL